MITDIVIELQGARDSSQIDQFDRDGLTLDLTQYEISQKLKNVKRKLKRMGRGAGDTDPQKFLRAEVTKKIVDEVVGVRRGGDQIGAVCISGYSKGSIYALRLAQELFENSVEITYIGLSDLPLFPFGYIPPIDHFPDMKPINNPESSVRRFDLPIRTIFPPVVIPPTITAGTKKNYFQSEGNGMEPTLLHPPFLWWSSNMPQKEIHGKLQGWDNLDLNITPKANDEDNHQEGDDQGLIRIGKDISLELAIAAR